MKLKLFTALCLYSISMIAQAETLRYQMMCPSAKQIASHAQANQKSFDVPLFDDQYNKKGTAKFTYNISPNFSAGPLPEIKFGYVYVISNNSFAPMISCVYVEAGKELLNKAVLDGNIGNLPDSVSTVYLNHTPGGYGYAGRSCEGQDPSECKLSVYDH